KHDVAGSDPQPLADRRDFHFRIGQPLQATQRLEIVSTAVAGEGGGELRLCRGTKITEPDIRRRWGCARASSAQIDVHARRWEIAEGDPAQEPGHITIVTIARRYAGL